MRCLRWFCFNTCGNVHALGIRGSVRRGQKFLDPFALLDAQGGDGLPQLPDAGPLAVAILHAVASRGCSHSLATGGEWLVRSSSYFALVYANASSVSGDHFLGVKSSLYEFVRRGVVACHAGRGGSVRAAGVILGPLGRDPIGNGGGGVFSSLAIGLPIPSVRPLGRSLFNSLGDSMDVGEI